MKKFLLIVFAQFEDEFDIISFFTEKFKIDSIFNPKFIIESPRNIIIRFESDLDKVKISSEIFTNLKDNNISFYFLIKLEDLVSIYLPEQLKSFLYGDDDDFKIAIPDKKENESTIFKIDDILDKIEEYGINSITEEEKKFLDNYKL